MSIEGDDKPNQITLFDLTDPLPLSGYQIKKTSEGNIIFAYADVNIFGKVLMGRLDGGFWVDKKKGLIYPERYYPREKGPSLATRLLYISEKIKSAFH